MVVRVSGCKIRLREPVTFKIPARASLYVTVAVCIVMPSIDSQTLIHAPLDVVYAIAKDNRAFPDFMEDVKSLTVVQDDGKRVVSDWVGVISAFNLKVRWTQEDVWNDSTHRCEFNQLKGDYDSMTGFWQFSAAPENPEWTKFESHVDYEYNVPGLGALVKKVVHNLATKNVDGLLAAIRTRAESQFSNQ